MPISLERRGSSLRTSFKGPSSQKGETSEESVDISTIYSTYFNAFNDKEVHCWLLLVSVLYYPYLKHCIFFDVFYTEALCWNYIVAYSRDIVPAGEIVIASILGLSSWPSILIHWCSGTHIRVSKLNCLWLGYWFDVSSPDYLSQGQLPVIGPFRTNINEI